MATEAREDNYELELNRVREKIETKFAELGDCLKARENELLIELDTALASYLSYRIELEKALFESIEAPIGPKMFTFECDSNYFLAELNKLGKLAEKGTSGTEYKSKIQPLVGVCEGGKGMEQLYCPHGVAVDNKTGIIYIADQGNNCVKAFDNSGEPLFKFGDNEGKGMMHYPKCVAIYGDNILISQRSNCILNYRLNGEYISTIGKKGNGKLEFDCLYGLAIDELNLCVYICDRDNNRIQILFYQDFSFVSQFGNDTLKRPHDIKLSKEYICVLDTSNPCLHLFDYTYVLQKSVISLGQEMQVVDPCYFFIDKSNNVLISDRESNSINIFSPQFRLVHKIPVSESPTGVTVDNQGRVIIVCQSYRDCLQIF